MLRFNCTDQLVKSNNSTIILYFAEKSYIKMFFLYLHLIQQFKQKGKLFHFGSIEVFNCIDVEREYSHINLGSYPFWIVYGVLVLDSHLFGPGSSLTSVYSEKNMKEKSIDTSFC